MSAKLCKKRIVFFSCDFPVANPRFLLYFIIFLLVCFGLIDLLLLFLFGLLFCYFFVVFFLLVIKPDMEGTVYTHTQKNN